MYSLNYFIFGSLIRCMHYLTLLLLITFTLAADDTLLQISTKSTCIRDVVSLFVGSRNCSSLDDNSKSKVLKNLYSLLLRCLNVFSFKWANLYLKNVYNFRQKIVNLKGMYGILSALFSHTSIISVIFIGKCFTMNRHNS